MQMKPTYDELNRALCAIITTLDEVEYAPVSTLYLGIGRDPEKWEAVRQVLEQGNLAIIDADNNVRLTPAGRAMAAKINAFMAKNTPPGSPYNERKL
jgi:hypothetical protein